MKKIPVAILGASVGFAVASWVVSDRLTTRHTVQLARQEAAWQAEKAALELALGEAKARAQAIAAPVAPKLAAAPAVPTKMSPAELVAKLFALKSAPVNQTRAGRQVIYWLEELIAAGPAALSAIRDFLNRNEDIDFAPVSQGKGGRGRNGDSILPLSLRFGLFDAVKQIGGADAEKLLAEVLGATGRDVEVALLARTAQEIAPNKYRDVALAAARELLPGKKLSL